MGTSRNDRSPQIPPWKPALAVLGKPEVPVERQNREIWLAAVAERSADLLRDFSSPSLTEACSYLSERLEVGEALRRFDQTTLYKGEAGLVIDMARRALARCAAAEGDAGAFVSELFAEAVSYYASRDLPSFVAAEGRIANTSASVGLKDALRKVTKERVMNVGEPALGRREWRRYISKVFSTLQGKGSSE